MSGLLGSALAHDGGYRLQVLGGLLRFFSPPCRRLLEADKTGLSFFEPFVHGRACPSQVTCDFARRTITRIVGHVCHPGSFGRTSSFLGSVFAGGFAVVGSHQRNLSSVESTWDEVPVRGATMYGILFFCKSLSNQLGTIQLKTFDVELPCCGERHEPTILPFMDVVGQVIVQRRRIRLTAFGCQ